ncbi:MAG TPA: hypothetical protein VGK90_12390 [Rhizomicrobium sp.]|jgi:hypothetical protein
MTIAGVVLYFFAVCLFALFPFPVPTDTAVLFYRQDYWLLMAECGLLLAASVRPGDQASRLELPQIALPLIALGLIVFCYIGGKWFLCGFAVSRDEQMAIFDSRIFGAGHLVQHLLPFWQAHTAALNTIFMLPAVRPVAWVSGYLPMNAILRTAVGLVADPALTGPLMVALGLVSLWKCARLLWPDDREAAVVALLLYIGSGQVLFAGMTAYAMPAHLAFNLLWLWLFLLKRPLADVGALLVAFVATGLHQPLFHPLFAAPILFTLLLERNWPRVLLFGIGYGAICAFWLEWPGWMHLFITGPHSANTAAATDYFARLRLVISQGDPMRWRDIGANLLRFFAWQHLLFLPLMAVGIAATWRNRLAGAFAASVILPVIIMSVLLSYQGHGFGYRYLHGVIGVAILLAVFGWRWLAERHGWLRPLFIRATLAGLLVVMPLQAWMAHGFYAPDARSDRQIANSGVDYFITGGFDAPYSQDLVINRADLSNRPLRLIAEKLDDTLIQGICRTGARVALPTSTFYRPLQTYYYLAQLPRPDARIATLSPRLKAAGCSVAYLDGT